MLITQIINRNKFYTVNKSTNTHKKLYILTINGNTKENYFYRIKAKRI